ARSRGLRTAPKHSRWGQSGVGGRPAGALHATPGRRSPAPGGGVMAAEQPFVHRVRVRYGEVDMQQVVFNAHYLAYCDDPADLWFQAMGLDFGDGGWDVMVKK